MSLPSLPCFRLEMTFMFTVYGRSVNIVKNQLQIIM